LPGLTSSKAQSTAEVILRWREEASAGAEGQDVDKSVFVAYRDTLQQGGVGALQAGR
jgi:hypothetical protein